MTQGDALAKKPNCRWCGRQASEKPDADDWQCEYCTRYQDATTCPTCGNLCRLSLLPPEMQPEPVPPVD